MTHEELQIAALELETTLVMAFLPYFYNKQVILDENLIHFVLSCERFEDLNVNERLALVFSRLRFHDAEVLEKCSVVVEAFNSKEVENLIDYYL